MNKCFVIGKQIKSKKIRCVGGGAECRTHKSIDPVQISVIFFLQILYILIILHSLFATRGEGFKGTLKLKELTSFLKFQSLKTLELSYHVFFYGIGLRSPSPGGHQGGGRVWGYPKRKTDVIFEILTIENPRNDISHVFFRGLCPLYLPGGGLGLL